MNSLSGVLRTRLACGLALFFTLGCSRDAAEETAAATCEALSNERFEEALALSHEGAGSTGAGREIAECRCLAFLSIGNRDACTTLLGALLVDPAAADWVPHSVLSKLMVRTWQGQGRIAEATSLATRAAPVHRSDLDLLQLEVMLRTATEDEGFVLRSIESRLRSDPSWTAQRIVLALGWKRRADYAAALRVLGSEPPAVEHPLVLPWYESRIQAQAASGDLAAVQASFAQWRSAGWDPTDLAARYALRLSVEQLADPAHDTIDLIREALATQDQLRDRNIVWGLHRRLITELLGAGQPEQALEAYDAAAQIVDLEGITREEIERAIELASGSHATDAPATLAFGIPTEAIGGTLWLSPAPDQAPDAGYTAHVLSADEPTLRVSAAVGLHPRRWILHDAAGNLRGSGAVWPRAGNTIEVQPQLSERTAAALASPAASNPSDRPVSPTSATRSEPGRGDGRRRVFAILADCGDWRLTEYLRMRGELPFHDQMFSEGYRAVLRSHPAFTAAAMDSLVWPSEQRASGSLGWVHHLGLELAGLESIGRNPLDFLSWVLPERPNLFATLGAGSLVTANMLLAHGQIDAGRHAEVVGPDGARRSLPSPNAYRPLRDDELARYPALVQDLDTQKFTQAIAAEMDAAESIARDGEVDFLFLRLEALDLITHSHFAALDGRGQDDGAGPLLDAYRYIDERLAALHAVLDDDDWLVLLSDHGIRSAMQHEEDALFVAIGKGVPSGRAPGQPALRGVPRSLAAMLHVETDWPDTGTTPWLDATRGMAQEAPAAELESDSHGRNTRPASADAERKAGLDSNATAEPEPAVASRP